LCLPRPYKPKKLHLDSQLGMPTARKFAPGTTFVVYLAQQMRQNADQYTTTSFFSRVGAGEAGKYLSPIRRRVKKCGG
ncbi:MAG TPA: hypothetical protein VHE33_07665, partial [Acidobacteriaceae bacterium]|nr:hypothetical protein [Acidobacteriaceae bacterium]